MILGIDVGGTHTDAVLVDKKGIINTAKVKTQHDNLLHSIRSVLEIVISGQNSSLIDRFNLSTTLCTNAIVQDELEDVGVLVTAGPGIDPANFNIGKNYTVLQGGLDHRGTELISLDIEEVQNCIDNYVQKGLRVFAIIGKFSPRNPVHEQKISSLLANKCTFFTQGHVLSGQLNFPRRIATAYYNSAVWPIFNDFANSISNSVSELGISPWLNFLKADGGTMSFSQAKVMPVESIFSGPAASIMGIVSLCDIQEDAILLDIGGTTTDVAIFASGDPLIEAESVELEHRPTLVRAMKTKSIGVGGDIAVAIADNKIKLGSKRLGPCLAQGGPAPTFIDALNSIGDLHYGNVAASEEGILKLASQLKVSKQSVALQMIQEVSQQIRQESMEMLSMINERPIYTVYEFLEHKKIRPKKLYLMGGPAQGLASYLRTEFGLPVVIPDNYSVANALGAALARPTYQIELLADTEKKSLAIPELEIYRKLPESYSLRQARKDIKAHLCEYLAESLNWYISQEEAEIMEESAMNIVKEFRQVGQDIRVKCQVKPGISSEYEKAVRCLCKEQ